MKMDIQVLCEKVESNIPTATTYAVPDRNQILVTFSNRPDVQIALLTPYYQGKLCKGEMSDSDVLELLLSVKRIANFGRA